MAERLKKMKARKVARPRNEYRHYQTIKDKIKRMEELDYKEFGILP
jgi:hypothetical protein